jgi:hypothetical protein
MEYFILLFIAYTAFSALKGGKKTKVKAQPFKAASNPWDKTSVQYDDAKPDETTTPGQTEFQQLKAKIQTMSKSDFSRQARENIAEKVEQEQQLRISAKINAQDNNRQRRDDWGQRAGPDLLSSRNIIVLVGVFLVAFLLGQTLST